MIAVVRHSHDVGRILLSAGLLVSAVSPAPGAPGVPPNIPPASQAFQANLPDGAYSLADGPLAPWTMRPIALQAMPLLGQYGFRRFITTQYIGMSRSIADATPYFAPLIQTAAASNMTFIPGLWLHQIVEDLYGRADQPPWNVTGPDALARHPMNPWASGEQRFWDDFVARVTVLARAAQSTQVFIDTEFLFYMHKSSPFFTDTNLAALRVMFRNAVAQLRSSGILLIEYELMLNDYDPEIQRITLALCAPDGPNDPLAYIEHFQPSPWFVPWGDAIGPAWVDARYAQYGYSPDQPRYGFDSDNQPRGYCPEAYDTYLRAHPGAANRAWYYSGTPENVLMQASRFAAMISLPAAPDGKFGRTCTADGDDIRMMLDAIAVHSIDPTVLAHGDFNRNGVMDPGDLPGFVGALLTP